MEVQEERGAAGGGYVSCDHQHQVEPARAMQPHPPGSRSSPSLPAPAQPRRPQMNDQRSEDQTDLHRGMLIDPSGSPLECVVLPDPESGHGGVDEVERSEGQKEGPRSELDPDERAMLQPQRRSPLEGSVHARGGSTRETFPETAGGRPSESC